MKPYEVVNAALESDLPTSARMILVAVAFAAGADGACWQSAATLARRTGLHERTARKILADLVSAGWLTADSQPGRTTVYRPTLGPDPGRETLNPGRETRGTPGVRPGWVGRETRGTPGVRPATPGVRPGDPGREARRSDPRSDPDPIPDPIRGEEGLLKEQPPARDTPSPPGLTDDPTLVVVGRREPDPDQPQDLVIAELLELQQQAGQIVGPPDRRVVTQLLVDHRAEVLRQVWATAAADPWWQAPAEDGQPRLRWRSVGRAGPGLAKRLGRAIADLDAAARSLALAAGSSLPDPATIKIRPPPPVRAGRFT